MEYLLLATIALLAMALVLGLAMMEKQEIEKDMRELEKDGRYSVVHRVNEGQKTP